MDTHNQFCLNEAIEKWEKANFSQEELIPADNKEFRSHILDAIDELQETGLSKEEAFTIAQMRFGSRKDWGGDMQILNEDNLQLKKVVLVFSGVIFFIFSYHLILCGNRLILLLSNYYNGDVISNIENAKVFFNIVYALSVSAIVALYFLHQPIKWMLKRITLNSTSIFLIIAVLIIVIVVERYLYPQISISIDDRLLTGNFFTNEIYFKYIYFAIVILGYLIIYFRYNKKYYI